MASEKGHEKLPSLKICTDHGVDTRSANVVRPGRDRRASLTLGGPACALTPESPEVRKLIDAGLAFIENRTRRSSTLMDADLGGKCLVGLAFIKAGKPDHPRVQKRSKPCARRWNRIRWSTCTATASPSSSSASSRPSTTVARSRTISTCSRSAKRRMAAGATTATAKKAS